MRSKSLAAGLAAASLALCPAGAVAQTDYSRNAANGQYVAPAISAAGHGLPAGPSSPVPVRATRPDGGFSFGAALAGAGVTLLLVGAVLGTRRTARRRTPPVPSGTPKLVSR
jgi:hypothetical protein